MEKCGTFWVVTVSMTIIVIIVAVLALYIYQTTKRLSEKGEELYSKSAVFLQQGNTALNRVNTALDKVEPVVSSLASDLPAIRDSVVNFIREKPLQSWAKKIF